MAFKIQWAPMNVPLRRRIETLCIIYSECEFLVFPGICLAIYLYLLFKTQYWWICLLYALWYIYDQDTVNRGGRRIPFLRRTPNFKYLCSYFPIRFHKTADIDPSKNYLFGYHPHGIMSCGAFGGFVTEGAGFSKVFPGITPHIVTLMLQFRFPFYRELQLGRGCIPANKEAIDYCLNPERKGHACVIVIGGASEALDAVPGTMKLLLKNRKGFVKLAIKNGASLVPMIAFGENELFSQRVFNPDAFFTKLRKCLQKILTMSFPVFHGRGVFQYSYGLLPYRRPIDIIVGAPIDCERIERPSEEDIDRIHQRYIQALHDLFNENKEKYAKEYPQMKLEIV